MLEMHMSAAAGEKRDVGFGRWPDRFFERCPANLQVRANVQLGVQIRA